MKTTDKTGLYWLDHIGEGVVSLGLTEKALKRFGCLHVYIPHANGFKLLRGQVMASVESSKALTGLKSPLGGMVQYINEVVVDEPYTIDSDTILFTVVNKEWQKDLDL